MNENKRKVFIDTDIGDDIDDAFALALTMQMPQVEIVGVSTVYRNVDLRAKIVLALADAFGHSFPVAAGLDAPEIEPVKHFRFETAMPDGRPKITHYGDDMAGYTDYTHDAVDALLETAARFPHEVTLLALGPCTNVAAAYRKDPQRFGLFKDVLIMGADPTGARIEWNVRCDPEAFATVLDSGLKTTVVGLDVTNRCGIDEARLQRMFALPGKGNALLIRMLKVWIADRPGKVPTMHDPLTAALLEQSFCTFENVGLRVGLTGEDRGRTYKTPVPDMRIATDVDSDAFLAYLIGRLAR